MSGDLKEKLVARHKKLFECAVAKDEAGVKDCIHENAVFIIPQKEPQKGRDCIIETIKKRIEEDPEFYKSLSFDCHACAKLGDEHAVEQGRFSGKCKDGSERCGNYLIIWRKCDGVGKVVCQMIN